MPGRHGWSDAAREAAARARKMHHPDQLKLPLESHAPSLKPLSSSERRSVAGSAMDILDPNSRFEHAGHDAIQEHLGGAKASAASHKALNRDIASHRDEIATQLRALYDVTKPQEHIDRFLGKKSGKQDIPVQKVDDEFGGHHRIAGSHFKDITTNKQEQDHLAGAAEHLANHSAHYQGESTPEEQAKEVPGILNAHKKGNLPEYLANHPAYRASPSDSVDHAITDATKRNIAKNIPSSSKGKNVKSSSKQSKGSH